MANLPWAIGVDIGGTKINIASVNEEGEILRLIHIPTRSNKEPYGIISDIVSGIKTLISENPTPPLGVGVGMAGQIEAEKGIVVFAPNLKWHDFPLQSELNKALDLPISVTNDVRAATLGEWIFGAGQNCKDIVCIFIGTGIGGGVVSGGKMLTGNSNTAGEIGHMSVEIHGLPCTCSNIGCLEAYAGGWAIAKNAKQLIADHPNEKHGMGNPEQVTAKTVIEAFHADDPLAKQVIEKSKDALIAGTVSLVNAFNPKVLIFGGGITESLPELLKWVEEGVRKRALSAATKDLRITKSKLGAYAGTIGAASLALHPKPI